MKIRNLIILSAFALLMTGCGEQTVDSAAQDSPAETTAAAADAPETETTVSETETAAEQTTEPQTESQPAETEAPETDPPETEATEPETEPAPDPSAWKRAYTDVLRGSEATMFTLAYIDNDDIPELVLHYGNPDSHHHAETNVDVYTYYNGAAVFAGTASTDGYSYFGYNEREGIVFDSFIAQGHYLSKFYELRDGTLQLLHETESDDTMHYKVDGAEVTSEEHSAVVQQYESANYKNEQGEIPNNEENIRAYLLS